MKAELILENDIKKLSEELNNKIFKSMGEDNKEDYNIFLKINSEIIFENQKNYLDKEKLEDYYSSNCYDFSFNYNLTNSLLLNNKLNDQEIIRKNLQKLSDKTFIEKNFKQFTFDYRENIDFKENYFFKNESKPTTEHAIFFPQGFQLENLELLEFVTYNNSNNQKEEKLTTNKDSMKNKLFRHNFKEQGESFSQQNSFEVKEINNISNDNNNRNFKIAKNSHNAKENKSVKLFLIFNEKDLKIRDTVTFYINNIHKHSFIFDDLKKFFLWEDLKNEKKKLLIEFITNNYASPDSDNKLPEFEVNKPLILFIELCLKLLQLIDFYRTKLDIKVLFEDKDYKDEYDEEYFVFNYFLDAIYDYYYEYFKKDIVNRLKFYKIFPDKNIFGKLNTINNKNNNINNNLSSSINVCNNNEVLNARIIILDQYSVSLINSNLSFNLKTFREEMRFSLTNKNSKNKIFLQSENKFDDILDVFEKKIKAVIKKIGFKAYTKPAIVPYRNVFDIDFCIHEEEKCIDLKPGQISFNNTANMEFIQSLIDYLNRSKIEQPFIYDNENEFIFKISFDRIVKLNLKNSSEYEASGFFNFAFTFLHSSKSDFFIKLENQINSFINFDYKQNKQKGRFNSSSFQIDSWENLLNLKRKFAKEDGKLLDHENDFINKRYFFHHAAENFEISYQEYLLNLDLDKLKKLAFEEKKKIRKEFGSRLKYEFMAKLNEKELNNMRNEYLKNIQDKSCCLIF